MKTIIAGSRTINDPKLVHQAVKDCNWDITEVVCGGAKGIDSLGAEWAKANNIPIKLFPADWNTFGKRAGIIRNLEMACYADALIAIWDGHSRGTLHMITAAKQYKLRIYYKIV